MNPIAVNVVQGKVVFPGVAEAAAAGSTPTSLVDLFGQILANAQAGMVAAVEGAAPQGEGADGSDAEATVETADVAAVLAAALAGVSATAVNDVAVTEDAAVAPVTAVTQTVSADAVVDAALNAEVADAVEMTALLQPRDAQETVPPQMTLAMQLAAARAGLGAEGDMTARRFGDAAVPQTRTTQPLTSPTEEGVPEPTGEVATPSTKATGATSEQTEAGGDTDDGPRDFFKPVATLISPKGEGSPFDIKTGVFAGAEVHAATTRARTEPVMLATQSDVPQSVSVRDVGDVVVRSVQYLSGRTEDVVTVRLVPQSLGELRIAVHSGERGMEVVLTAANNAAREALEMNLHGLREALGREGMTIERVSVQVFAPFDGGHQPASQQNAHGSAGQSARQPNTAYRESSGSPQQQQSNSEQQPRRQQHGGRLNMWV